MRSAPRLLSVRVWVRWLAGVQRQCVGVHSPSHSTCWHHDFVIVTAGSDLATLAALCIYCTQRLCHDAVKYQYGTRTPVSPGAAQQQAADFGALDLREAHGAAVARGQP